MTDAATVARLQSKVHKAAPTKDRVATSRRRRNSRSAISRHAKANAAPVSVVPIRRVGMHRRGRTLLAQTSRRVDGMTDRPRRLRQRTAVVSGRGFRGNALRSDGRLVQ